jgi:H+-transporting ATPase
LFRVQVDQAALTGESLPVTMHPGVKLKMGSAVKRGEQKCIVVATGTDRMLCYSNLMNLNSKTSR